MPDVQVPRRVGCLSPSGGSISDRCASCQLDLAEFGDSLAAFPRTQQLLSLSYPEESCRLAAQPVLKGELGDGWAPVSSGQVQQARHSTRAQAAPKPSRRAKTVFGHSRKAADE